MTENWGSNQLRTFRRAFHRDGLSIEAAAIEAGMPLGEARLWAKDDAERPTPLPGEAFEPIRMSASSTPAKEATMARTARKKEDDTGEVAKKDFKSAVRAYRTDIKSAASKVGEHAQEISTAYKFIKKNCHIQPQAAKVAFKLEDMEEAKRDDFIRCFVGLLEEMNIPLQSNDLVDQAEGKTEPRPRPSLVTIPGGPGIESDDELATAAGETPTDLKLN